VRAADEIFLAFFCNLVSFQSIGEKLCILFTNCLTSPPLGVNTGRSGVHHHEQKRGDKLNHQTLGLQGNPPGVAGRGI